MSFYANGFVSEYYNEVFYMNYKVNWDDGIFAVPDSAADCLKLASGKSVKVLLYFLKYRSLPENPDIIGVTQEDIEDAMSYWEQVGVIYRADGEMKKSAAATAAPVKIVAASPESKTSEKVRAAVPRPQKSLLPSEIADRIAASEEIAFLFSSAEASLRRVLTFDDQRTILWFYDHLGMSADIIIMLIAYCCSIERYNMAYIEKIAADWHEKNITTHEQAENEILLMQKKFSFEGKVQSRLKLQSKLTASQKKYIGDWAMWDIDIDMVELAYDKTVDATGKPAFGYMNKILQKWHDNGVSSAQEAREFDERTRPVRGGTEKPQAAPVQSGSSPSFDLSLILEHAKNSTPTV